MHDEEKVRRFTFRILTPPHSEKPRDLEIVPIEVGYDQRVEEDYFSI